MTSFSPGDNRVQMDSADSPKKPNYDISETKVKGEDYTRPSMSASQTKEGDDLRSESVEEEYEVPANRKNPERNAGRPGIRVHQDTFTDTGLPQEYEAIYYEETTWSGFRMNRTESYFPQDEYNTTVAVDDSTKHGTKNKYRIGGGEGKTGSKDG